jgi:hypothetical protein
VVCKRDYFVNFSAKQQFLRVIGILIENECVCAIASPQDVPSSLTITQARYMGAPRSWHILAGDCDRAIVHSRRSSPARAGYQSSLLAAAEKTRLLRPGRGRANKFIRVGECMFFIGNKYHARAAIIMRN